MSSRATRSGESHLSMAFSIALAILFASRAVAMWAGHAFAIKRRLPILAGERMTAGAAEFRIAFDQSVADGNPLVGPPERIRERLQMWEDSAVTTLNVAVQDVATMRKIAELVNP